MEETQQSQEALKPLYIRISDQDNVAIVVNEGGLPAGAVFACGLTLQTAVPQGHKVALQAIPKDAPVIRYGVVIGHALSDVAAGTWINEAMLRMPQAPSLDDLPLATRQPGEAAPLTGLTFDGYRNADGTIGTRNILAISATVQCVTGVVEFAVRKIREELLPRYPNVDDVVYLEHGYGCGVAIDAPHAEIPIRTLRNLSLNPNFGGQILLVSLGCEKLQATKLFPAGSIPIAQDDPYLITLQDEENVGFASMIEAIMAKAERRLAQLNARKREPCPLSGLVVGVQCGGSDAFSGVTANPVVGYATDLLVRAGATVMFSEVTEVRDGIAQLTARAATPEIGQALLREMQWYDDYLKRGGADRSANTSPGNKRGGLSNIVEKAMGSIVKSGTSAISGVVAPGERVAGKGLNFLATPASDFICGTLQLAAGMNLHVFTTGRGTPYGLAAVPVIKVATRDSLARRWFDLMDLNAGRIATGQATIEQVGQELFDMMIAIASGRQQSCAEKLKLHNSLVLFNPAPVT
ncbi:D-galactarate dehydratase [Advenella mimigardefordensis DPN7]|uniref:Galactarate dehydratase n=1 Tax=Advenella mimigardefordensis (strain DSM 17166 / LMG 22922 / DPN7) TaxID=1247726 RepID=W0PHG9_ADVMD|nr:galactarate dehydratase [Advenella mimigardefordensis]AHG64895.1 D-galactarate dehydratase [Advenella mimigardefordensis DPN7]